MVEPITTMLVGVAAKEAVTAIVKPIISSTFKSASFISDALSQAFTDQFVGYINRQLEKHSCLSTLVFQSPMPLESLYIPLTLKRLSADSGEESLKINQFSCNFIPVHKRVLITDTAGMGKSTLMRYLLIQCIRSNFAVPIFIELRHLSQSQSVLTLLLRELNQDWPDDKPPFTQERIKALLKKGGLVFFLDGYDEIPFKDREAVTRDIKSIIESYPTNYYALTSRPETGLSAFPSFTQFRIAPLKKEESFELIRKYDKNGQRSQQLIERLSDRELNSVHEFLENPLLTTLLYRCFEYKQNVPEKKHVFYRQVFDALYDWHDASKDGYNTREKKSKLDLDSFHRVLRVIGFISTMRGEIEGEKDKILSWIREAKQVCVGLSFGESDFLDDLTQAVPVFARDGLYYRWSHKSMAEYFAAQYICTEGKAQQDQVFQHIRNSELDQKFINMLDQVYDLDQPAFRKYFTHPFAEAYVDFCNTAYKGLSPDIPIEEIDRRRGLTFAGPLVLVKNGPPSPAEMNAAVKELSYPATEAGDEWGLPLLLVASVKVPNLKRRIVVLGLVNKWTTTAAILGAKHDPLMKAISRASTQKPLPLKGLGNAKAIAVTDKPDHILNTKENFLAVNRALLQIGGPKVIIDREACRVFCATFADEEAKANFTNNLLAKLRPSGSN